MKKLILILLIIFMLMFAACSTINYENNKIDETAKKDTIEIIEEFEQSEIEDQTQMMTVTFSRNAPKPLNEAISECYSIVNAELTNIIKSDKKTNLSYYYFTLNDIYKGNSIEETFKVSIYNETAYVDGANIFNLGDKYILFLDKHQSVFRGTGYTLNQGLCIKAQNSKVEKMYQQGKYYLNKKLQSIDSLKLMIAEDVENANENGNNISGASYTDSEKPNEIVSESKHIVTVKITEDHSLSGYWESSVGGYLCTLIESYKDEVPIQFFIFAFRDDIIVGEEYLLLLSEANDELSPYRVSSKNSCIPLSDTELYEEYMQHINK